MTPLEEILHARRSVRRFKPDPVPRDMIERVLDAAVTAPSASNKQPWRFLVVTKQDTIGEMAAAVREAKDRIAARVPASSRDPFLAYGDYFTRFEGAPLVIVPIWRGMALLSSLVSGDTEIDPDDLDAIREMERSSGIIGAALALENMLLAAHAIGLGASGMTGPLVARPRLRTILGVQDTWDILALVPLGFSDETPVPTDRKAARAVTRWIE